MRTKKEISVKRLFTVILLSLLFMVGFLVKQEIAFKDTAAQKSSHLETVKVGNIYKVIVNTSFAQEPAPAATPAPAPVVDDKAFFVSVLDAIQKFGGLSWMAQVAMVLGLLLASMKVSFLRPIWDKLGDAKAWAAPLLGLLYGVVSLKISGDLTLAGAMAYFGAGAGAIILHELLDSLKSAPGIGHIYVGIIDLIEKLALKPDPKKV
jgi:hypothetical protein